MDRDHRRDPSEEPVPTDAPPALAAEPARGPSARTPQQQKGYPDDVLQPASLTTAETSPPQLSQRERLPSAASTTAMSSSARGKRAPAPAALDLSPRRERAPYGDIGLGQGASSRRVVTEPRVARPLPQPPSSSSLMASRTARYPSSHSLYASSHSPLTCNPTQSQLSSPAQPHPSDIDRRNLIGVGELATPLWPGTGHPGTHTRTPSVPSYGSTPSVPPVPRTPVREGLENGGSRPRSNSATQTPPRPPTKSPARRPSRETMTAPNTATPDGSLYSLASLAQFNFGSSMETSLAASLASLTAQNAPQAAALPQLDTVMSPSPGSARSRIYARRQEREKRASLNANYADNLSQPPTSADSQTQTFGRAGRDSSRKTPPNPARHSSSHDILKQFAVKDFSHLPPSPSSASINQFLRQSASVSNMASTPPATTSATSQFFPGKIVQRNDSQRSIKQKGTPKPRERDLDPSVEEALRKLDGLANTPGKPKVAKRKSSTGVSAVNSRPGTPPAESRGRAEGRVPSKMSNHSLKDAGSPLNNWVDLSDDIPAIPVPRARVQTNRESASSVSMAGTPTSRDSHSLPTTATTISSTDLGVKGRRMSASSDISAQGVSAETKHDEVEKNVPPVPPLPQVYVNKKQSTPAAVSGVPYPMSYVPTYEPSPPPLHSPSDSMSPASVASQQPKMHKKWSFSSALNLKSTSSPVPSVEEAYASTTTPRSPQTPWSEIHRGELLSPSSSVAQDFESGPSHSAAFGAPLAANSQKAATINKRLTPSSIPFFRRSSSSTFQNKVSQPPMPETPKQSKEERNAPSSQRKSVLGMHIPSMLRGSASKRGLAALSQQPVQKEKEKEKEEVKEPTSAGTIGSMGWTGRKRGKTLSISGDLPKPIIPTLKHQTSADSSLSSSRSSAVSNRSDATIQGSATFDRLPAIMGSPAMAVDGPRYSNSPRNMPSATPTKIPRIARPQPSPATISTSTANHSMPPPAFPSQKKAISTMAGTGEHRQQGPISEFGVVEGMPSTPRQTTSSAHRTHLLAPMSARHETRRASNRPSDPPLRRDPPATAVPASRRQLPIPPSSTVTAMTLSASAKRTSREFRSKQESKEPDALSSGKNSPMKPSKSLHSGIAPLSVVPRLPSSHSAGAAGSSLRKLALADSSSISPADDDEVNADAEMEAYIKRRRERAATSRKDNLSDVNEFPEDLMPVTAVSQRMFITKNLANMTDQERKEVLDFDLIYYSPLPGRIHRPVQPGGAIYNHGYDDERGDYLVVEGDHICYRYEVIGILGKGSFGQVVQCRDHKTGRSVAVKIIRNKKRFHAQALVEVKILQQLVEWDPEDKHFMVRMTDHFSFRSHLCIVTELLSINLYELIKFNQFAGFSTTVIRRFTTQMLASLQLMRSHRIVHCDLKPENILLCHPSKSAIKVIDFGSSCLETEKVYTYIQSRFYRSPEVILGMNYAMAIDMWSLGCILAELYTGVPIFPGENEHEQLACIMEILGVPERYIIEKASRRKNFFDTTGAPRPFVNAKGRRRRPGSKTLAGVLKCDDELFVDFIARCLTWDPDKRLKPQPAMRHPWILAGRKRYVPTPNRDERRTSDRSSRLFASAHTPLRSSSKNLGDSATPSGKSGERDKSKLSISSPVPLMARHPHHTAAASTSRIGHALGSSRLTHQSSARNGSFTTATKLSIG